MEVHHHPHVEKKNFKEYILEFIMIFLAVAMGFFAESVRERIVNNDKEQVYMESLVQDLKKDNAEMAEVMNLQNIFMKKMDSALQIPVENLTTISSQDTFYHHFIFFYSWVYLFYQNDITITQLKNAGGFSVIRNKAIIDSIAELQLFYDQQVKLNGDYYNEFWKHVVDISQKMIKCPEPPTLIDTLFHEFPNHVEVFTRYDRPLLEELYSCIRNEKGTLLVYMNYENQYNKMAIRCLNFIKKEYDLKN